VVREVVAAVAADAVAANVELRVAASRDVTGRWDRSRLRQVTLHLVTNAIRHSGGGPVDISVSHDDHQAELIVADRGHGIPAGRRARLFDAFDIAETRRTGGLGVGLWIVNTLCQHFKATVTLLDDDGPGARFRVVLPRV
jgi:signal transduction histidine kinase